MGQYIKNKLVAVIGLALLASFAGGALAVWAIITFDLLGLQQFFNASQPASRPVTIVSPPEVNLEFDTLIGNVAKDIGQRSASIYLKKSALIMGFNKLYTDDEIIGNAVAVTNDGWFLSSYRPVVGKQVVHIPAFNGGKIYEIEKVVADPHSSIVFFKVALDAEMSVISFSDFNTWQVGQTVIGWRGDGEVILGNIKRIETPFNRANLISSSEVASKSLAAVFNGLSGSDVVGMSVYDLSGRLMATADKKGELVYIGWQQAIVSLLKRQAIIRAYFGVHYMPVDKFIGGNALLGQADVRAGALIKGWPGEQAVALKSPARTAGLKEGDIIVAVENDAIDDNSTLDQLIQEYQPGDSIEVTVISSLSGQQRTLEVILGEY